MDGVVVSRLDLFEPASPSSPALAEDAYTLEFETVDVSDVPSVAEPETHEFAFQLFSSAPGRVDLEAREPELVQRRPSTYYFFAPTDTDRASYAVAVTGDWVRAQAPAPRETTAPDINADFVPPRRRCRPGASARRKRRARKAAEKPPKQNFFRRKRKPVFQFK